MKNLDIIAYISSLGLHVESTRDVHDEQQSTVRLG